jgi:hypothetical protein
VGNVDFELDEQRGELFGWKYTLLGKSYIHKRIPLDKIEAIRIYRLSGSRINLGLITIESKLGVIHEKQDTYFCDLLLGDKWEPLAKDLKELNIIRLAAMIGLHLENPQKKLKELADSLPNLKCEAVTIAAEMPSTFVKYRKLTKSVDLRYSIGKHSGKSSDIQDLRVEGVISINNSSFDSIDILRTDKINSHYLIAFSVSGEVGGNLRAGRIKKLFSSSLDKIVWRGGPSAEKLNSDSKLQVLLLEHLHKNDCNVYTRTDQSNGNTMIIFGDSYPRQWIKLPERLFPTEERIQIVTKLAEHIRSSQL